MWLMLQHDFPEDFVISTNEFHSVREFVEKAFKLKGYSIKWEGKGLDEVGYDEISGQILIRVNEKYFRPCEVDFLLGDSSKAFNELGWKPQINFEELVTEMVEQ
jgi:GDPmannose 4,6-dehydratase